MGKATAPVSAGTAIHPTPHYISGVWAELVPYAPEINMIIMNMLTIAVSVFAASFILLATDVCRSGTRASAPERLPVSSWRHRLRPPPRGRPARIRYCPAGEPRSVVGRRA